MKKRMYVDLSGKPFIVADADARVLGRLVVDRLDDIFGDYSSVTKDMDREDFHVYLVTSFELNTTKAFTSHELKMFPTKRLADEYFQELYSQRKLTSNYKKIDMDTSSDKQIYTFHYDSSPIGNKYIIRLEKVEWYDGRETIPF